MAITLQEAKIGMADKVDQQVVDMFRRSSLLLDNMVFDNAISPGTGGSTLTYGYIQLKSPSTASVRTIGGEYTPGEAKKEKKTTGAIIMGELLVYDWGGDGKGDHIGIVEKYEKGKLTVIEGNYKDSVGRREVTKGSKNILGYCLPDYESYGGNIDTVKKVQQYLNFTYNAKLELDGIAGPKTKKALLASLQTAWNIDPDGIFGPITERAANRNVVGKGCCSETVRHLQMLLICAGYKLTADGIFGSKTENALVAFQKKTSLAPDGLAGKNSFKKLCS